MLSHLPLHDERMIASMHAMFATASSSGAGCGRFSRIARENSSAWIVNWSQVSNAISFDAAAVHVTRAVDRNPARPVGWSIERNLDLDSAAGADDLDSLVVLQLRAARTDRVSSVEVEHHRGQPVDSELLIDIERAGDARTAPLRR